MQQKHPRTGSSLDPGLFPLDLLFCALVSWKGWADAKNCAETAAVLAEPRGHRHDQRPHSKFA